MPADEPESNKTKRLARKLQLMTGVYAEKPSPIAIWDLMKSTVIDKKVQVIW
jgi:predicted HAD superfamily phosphohydrolase YqeG